MNDFSPTPDPHGNDPEEERLRRLLDEAVSDVEPREALGSIHARTKVSPMNSKRPWLLAAATAVVASAATVAAVTLLSDDAPVTDDGPDFAASQSATPEPSQEPADEPSPTDEPSEPATTEPASTSTETVPVYYVGDTSRGPRLYREFHRSEVTGGDTLTAALGEALGTTPDDPDYRTDWPGGTEARGSFDGDTITVDLVGADARKLRSRPAGMSATQADLAVEQILYTAQAAVQERAPVQLLLDGRHSDTVLGVPAAEPLAQGDAIDVLAQVWIIEPAEGAEVGSTFKVSGLAAAFEANVQWELMKGDQEIRRGFTTAEECCTMAPYSFRVKNVPPGDYTLVVHDSDPSGGEGPAPWTDTKAVTVTR